MQFSAQLANSLCLKKVYEVFALLNPINLIIRQYGETAITAYKAALLMAEQGGKAPSEVAKSKEVQQLAEACLALITLNMLSNSLMGKYAFAAQRLADLVAFADKRKAEENRDIQVFD